MAEKKVRLSKSGVSWTDYSWGVVDGCTKVSEACKHCYAEAMVTRFQPDRKFSEVRTHPERLEAPLNTKKPGKVFVAPLGDLFHESVPFEFIDQVFAVMGRTQQHIYQILTKRPERMLQYFREDRYQKILNESYKFNGHKITSKMMGSGIDNPKGWDNGEPAWGYSHLWLGVTAENQEQADKRIPILLQIPAVVRFISVEPMLGPVDLRHIQFDNMVEMDSLTGDHGVTRPLQGRGGNKLNWVIVGGESGSNARPMHPDWARSLRDQCIAAGVPFYFKQWGEWAPYDMGKDSVFYKTIAMLKTGGIKTVSFDEFNYYNNKNITSAFMTRFGTKKAGNLLDGQVWNQFPEVK